MELLKSMSKDPRFAIGQKITRAGVPGEVRGIFYSRRGKVLYAVEYMSGVFRICREGQLRLPGEEE
jgi:hypothetical protein